MDKIDRFMIKVRCPIDQVLRPLEIGFAHCSEGKRIPLPPNGCDNYHGSTTCQKCLASITLMLYEKDDPFFVEIITPDFSKLK